MGAIEREVMGSLPVPPPALTRAVNAGRRLVGLVHRRTAPAPLRIMEAVLGQLDAAALAALVHAGVPDALDRPRPIGDLAVAVGADAGRLDRVLRHAAARGFVRIDRRDRVRPTGVTRALRTDRRAPWEGWVRFATSAPFHAALRGLGPGLATGAAVPFEAANGHPFFAYAAADRDFGAVFDRAMEAGAVLQAVGLARTLTWADVASVCDVGGGTGAALDVLQRCHPHLSVTLFDLPEVVARSPLVPTEGRGGRAIESGSFFDAVPAGCDRYLLLAVVHDWDDERATRLLRNVGAAMGAEGRAVVVETVCSERPRDDFARATDLLMMTLATGRERTHAQYASLFAAAGLEAERTDPLPTGATAFTLRHGTPSG